MGWAMTSWKLMNSAKERAHASASPATCLPTIASGSRPKKTPTALLAASTRPSAPAYTTAYGDASSIGSRTPSAQTLVSTRLEKAIGTVSVSRNEAARGLPEAVVPLQLEPIPPLDAPEVDLRRAGRDGEIHVAAQPVRIHLFELL